MRRSRPLFAACFFLVANLGASFVSDNLHAQAFEWAKNAANGKTHFYNYGIAVGRAGSFVSVGFFQDSIRIGTTALLTPGASSGFVALYDHLGNPIWANVIVGPVGNFAHTYATALDSNGNVYLFGTYSGTAKFGTITLTTAMPSVGEYLAKLDNSGNWLWAKNIGNEMSENSPAISSIATDSLSNCYAVSQFTGTISIDSISRTAPALKFSNLLTKFNSAGTIVWARTFSTIDSILPYAIAATKGGHVYATGMLATHAIALNGSSLTPIGSGDPFLLQFDNTGAVQLAKVYGSNRTDWATNVATDALGDLYLSGEFLDTTQFGSTRLLRKSTTSYGSWLTKLNTAGAVQWTTAVGDSNSNDVNPIATDNFGNVYFGANYSGIQHLGAFTLSSSGPSNIAIVKYDQSGALQWLLAAGDSSRTILNSIGADGVGNTYEAGYYYKETSFGAIHLASPPTYYQGFIAKTNEPAIALHVTDRYGSSTNHSFCVGDTIFAKWSAIAQFQAGNRLTLQLSDSVGNFDTAHTLTIGSIASIKDSGTIGWPIPAGTPFGTGYRIRIFSTNPPLEGGQMEVQFAIHPLPIVSIIARKPATFCAGGSTDLVARGGKYFRWSSSADTTFSDTTETIEPTKAGTYYCAVTDSAGCQAMDSIVIRVLPLPQASVTPSGPTAFCAGDSVTITASGGVRYLWSTGDTVATITVDSSGNYSAVVTNSYGCSTSTSPIEVTVETRPATPSIIIRGDTLLSSATENNEWYKDDVLLSGDTNQLLIANTVGYYRVIVGKACRASSDSVYVSAASVARNAIAARLEFDIVPDPIRTSAILRYQLPSSTHVRLSLSNLLGEEMMLLADGKEHAGNLERPISVATLPSGTYFIRLQTDFGVLTRRVVIAR